MHEFEIEGLWCCSSVNPDAVAVYGLRLLVATAVSNGASVAPNAVAISSLVNCTSIKKKGNCGAAPVMTTLLGAWAVSLGEILC